MVTMADAVITEFAGTRKGPVTRFYQYSREGVRVLDTGKNLKRLYLFGPSADMMTERGATVKEKILRRFIFDQNGMPEETFSFGQRPRTFRYENGGRQIAEREGGQYGAVSKPSPLIVMVSSRPRGGDMARLNAYISSKPVMIQ